MNNPFKQIVPDQEPAQNQIQEEVMSSVHLKTHFSDILEFFMAIFGAGNDDEMPRQADNIVDQDQSQDPDHLF